jgi:DNA-damage-inducible protein D
MNKEIIISMINDFENFVHYTEENIEFWLARELQYLLGYSDWRNFLKVIVKAKTACQVSNEAVSDHFVGVNKTIDLPKSAKKDIPDIMLTRYACYLVAQNGDPRKEEIAFAQTYFAVKTRQAEIIEYNENKTETIRRNDNEWSQSRVI